MMVVGFVGFVFLLIKRIRAARRPTPPPIVRSGFLAGYSFPPPPAAAPSPPATPPPPVRRARTSILGDVAFHIEHVVAHPRFALGAFVAWLITSSFHREGFAVGWVMVGICLLTAAVAARRAGNDARKASEEQDAWLTQLPQGDRDALIKVSDLLGDLSRSLQLWAPRAPCTTEIADAAAILERIRLTVRMAELRQAPPC
jgi:hypothetical protein